MKQMARLIDADALKERAVRASTVKEHCYMKAVGTREIDKAPTVDAVPVTHGRWVFGIANHREYMKCSECLHSYIPDGTFCYCPNCGARMYGEK